MNGAAPERRSADEATARRWASLDRLLAALSVAGAGLLLGLLFGDGSFGGQAIAGTLAGWAAGGALWLGATRLTARTSLPETERRSLASLPLLPWLASGPLVALALTDPLAGSQIIASRWALGLYLAGGALVALLALVLWLAVVSPPDGGRNGGPTSALVAGGWWLAVPLLAFALLSYWNSAVLDPLQFRGLPDYVTQMKGARRLLAGQLPYDPTIRVWTDVNLPPITLLLLFAPFTAFSEPAGKLAYFTLNHLAFLAGLALLVVGFRPPRSVIAPSVWVALVAAMAMTFEPWHDSMRLGQQNGIVFFLLALTAVAFVRRRDNAAGAALSLALIGKPSSALLGVYFLFARRWRAAIAAAAVGLAAFAITLPWAGVENWRFYLFQKAPEILGGTPQQSNVALLAFYARLFLPRAALSSFDSMPSLPAAQLLSHVAQALGAYALWRIVRVRWAGDSGQASALEAELEFGVALVLSLSLTGHAWQSYVTWLIVAFAPLADPRCWAALPRAVGPWIAALAALSCASLTLNDVALYKVIGNTSAAAAFFASLPNVALLTLALTLALLLAAVRRASGQWPVASGQ